MEEDTLLDRPWSDPGIFFLQSHIHFHNCIDFAKGHQVDSPKKPKSGERKPFQCKIHYKQPLNEPTVKNGSCDIKTF